MKSTSLIAAAASCSGRGRNGQDPAELRVRAANHADGQGALRMTLWTSSDRVGFPAPETSRLLPPRGPAPVERLLRGRAMTGYITD